MALESEDTVYHLQNWGLSIRFMIHLRAGGMLSIRPGVEYVVRRLESNQMSEPIEVELSENGNNLYIFFGGIAAGIAMPIFEFYNASKIINESKIFIRDLSQCWYQDGLPEISKDICSTAQHLNSQIETIKPEKVYFIGNSMGGYAAILFANLIGCGEVIAFAPQTFISPILRIRHKDKRWKKQILNTYKKSFLKRKIWDLRPLLLHSKHSIKISIFVSKADKLDYIHASHISGIQGVNIYEFENGGHGIVKLLRDQGKLQAIMSGTYA